MITTETTFPSGEKVTSSVQHRFSEFTDLHDTLKQFIPAMEKSAFPVSKSMFNSDSMKKDRCDKFQEYLRQVVAWAGPRPPTELLKFLAVDMSNASKPPSSTPAASKKPAPVADRSDEGSSLLSHQVMSRPNDKNEALREGIKGNDTKFCLTLLEDGADPNYRDRRGDCPLHLACMFNRTEVVKALLEKGADINQKNASGELPSKIAPVLLKMKMAKFEETGKFG